MTQTDVVQWLSHPLLDSFPLFRYLFFKLSAIAGIYPRVMCSNDGFTTGLRNEAAGVRKLNLTNGVNIGFIIGVSKN